MKFLWSAQDKRLKKKNLQGPSGIFRNHQESSGIFKNLRESSGIFRHLQAPSGTFSVAPSLLDFGLGLGTRAWQVLPPNMRGTYPSCEGRGPNMRGTIPSYEGYMTLIWEVSLTQKWGYCQFDRVLDVFIEKFLQKCEPLMMPEFWVLNWGSKSQFHSFKTPHMRGSYPSFEGVPHMRGSWNS